MPRKKTHKPMKNIIVFLFLTIPIFTYSQDFNYEFTTAASGIWNAGTDEIASLRGYSLDSIYVSVGRVTKVYERLTITNNDLMTTYYEGKCVFGGISADYDLLYYTCMEENDRLATVHINPMTKQVLIYDPIKDRTIFEW